MRVLAAVIAGLALAAPAARVDAELSHEAGIRASVLVVRRGTVLLHKGYGKGVTSATVYDIGSIAKTFTAAAILRLDETGRLRLDQSIAELLPGVPPARRGVTVAELLAHTAGFPAYFSSDKEVVGYAAAVRRILAAPATPRGRFLYSDAGYTLLAAIVQRAAHEPFQRYVREQLFARAGLRQTGFEGDAALAGSPLAHGYARGRERGRAGTQARLSWSILGAGGILSTTGDLYRWARALSGGEVLDRRELAVMWRPHARTGGPGGAGAGYGWIVGRDRRGKHVVAVGGGTDFGFTADLRIYRGAGVVTVALSSTDRVPAPRLARILADAFGL